MNRQLNIGVIGLGRLGSLYANYFLGRISDAKLTAVVDINEPLAESFASQHNALRWHGDYREILADKNIDAIVIVTTTQAHKEIAVDCARARKPTFCEKPLSLSIAEALEMKAAIEQTGAFFQLGFMRRFDRGYAAAKRSIEEGSIGTPIVFKSSSRDPYRPSL